MVLGAIKRGDPEDSEDEMLVFDDPPNSAAWGRVRIHSERVRELVLGFGNCLPLLNTMLYTWPESSPILFPNLRQLKVIVEDEYTECEEILGEFFHQQVDSLILEIQWGDAHSFVSHFTQSILKEAGRCFRHLTSLSLELWDEVETSQKYVEAIAASFSLFTGLVKFKFPGGYLVPWDYDFQEVCRWLWPDQMFLLGFKVSQTSPPPPPS
ncbi:hypothetical protein D9758_011085 [Tetrapyrgos nigripes]|uniref:Uncharacterized protein n=1 Tax=Tetrapyrgos nigripes TaxID=182062 RepID=A0A8H5FS94_9AGAR|nr:hypothetical protein D9758_011085 [Tetrapyrgos nigripes]